MKKKKKTPQNPIVIYCIALSILCLVIFFSIIITLYFRKFDSTLAKENEITLSETAEQIAAHTRSIINDTQTSLAVAADAFCSIEDTGKINSYLSQIESELGFAYVGYASLDGFLHTTHPEVSENISSEDYFLDALDGKDSVTGLVRRIMYDKAVSGILLSTPISDDAGRISGVLVAMLDKKALQPVLSVSSFAGNGYSYVIDSSGELVLRTSSMDCNNFFLLLENVTFHKSYHLDDVLSDIRHGKSGITLYSNLGTEQYAYYLPLGFGEWTLVNIVARDAITANTASLTKELAVLSVISVAVFIILLAIAAAAFISYENQRHTAEMKSIFLANMSHELRTPMNTIVGVSELLLREELTKKQSNYTHMIVNSGKDLLAIINDILDFSKIESGKFTFVEEPYSLKSLLTDVSTLTIPRLEQKDVCFFIDVDENLPAFLLGDMARVKQILVNLLSNAVKFTDQGCICLEFTCGIKNSQVCLNMKITDTGLGIRKQDIPRLFISFNQVDSHHNHNLEGTGLGLAISRQLAKSMGGDITVESTYGKGSAFTAAICQKSEGQELLCMNKIPDDIRIAVFEASSHMRNYYHRVLKRHGADYEIYSSRDDLKNDLAIRKFHYIIADEETLKFLEKNGSHNFTSIVLLHQNEYFLYPQNTERLYIYAPLFSLNLPEIFEHKTIDDRRPKKNFDVSSIKAYPDARVLLADDNDLNLQIAAALLSVYHLKIDMVHSGSEAVRAVEQTDYNLVFMDHMMPEMDGIEALNHIRSLPGRKYKELPIIVLTANATHDAQIMFYEKGFDGFIPKPIDVKLLDSILNKYLDVT